jgi:hypothetical protein
LLFVGDRMSVTHSILWLKIQAGFLSGYLSLFSFTWMESRLCGCELRAGRTHSQSWSDQTEGLLPHLARMQIIDDFSMHDIVDVSFTHKEKPIAPWS